MSDAGSFGGTVVNNSSVPLIVAYNDPANPNQWRYTLLQPNSSSPSKVDIDGFRAQTSGVIIRWLANMGFSKHAHSGWWKIPDTTTATVVNSKDISGGCDFTISSILTLFPSKKSDADFGFDENSKLSPLPN